METSSSDIHVESAKIQQDIMSYLGVNSSELVFEFSNKDGKQKLDLITINPRHNQSFLFHSELGYDKIDALKKMLDYVKNYRDQESSYTRIVPACPASLSFSCDVHTFQKIVLSSGLGVQSQTARSRMSY